MKRKFFLKDLLNISFLTNSILPILILTFITVFTGYNYLKNEINKKNSIIAQMTGKQVEIFLDNSYYSLNHIARYLGEFENLNKNEDYIKHIKDIIDDFPSFSMMQILDYKGKIEFIYPLNPDLLNSDMSHHNYFKNSLNNNYPYWSDIFISSYTGEPSLTVSLYYKNRVYAAFIDLKTINKMTGEIKIGNEGSIIISDKSGTLIAYKNIEMVKQQWNIKNTVFFKNAVSKNFESFTYKENNIKYLSNVYIIKNTGWPLIISQPVKEAYSIFTKLVFFNIALLSVIIFISILISHFMNRGIITPINNLINEAKKIENSNYDFTPFTINFYEIDIFYQSFKKMSSAIQERETSLKLLVKEKETLLKEIHHRVKNNLLIIYGLFSMQQDYTKNKEYIKLLEDAKFRILSMNLVHKMLYESKDYYKINFTLFIKDLLSNIAAAYNLGHKDIKIRLKLDEIYMNMSLAVPVGLILNELITNAYKHAFQNTEKGIIKIELKKIQKKIIIKIADNGSGYPGNLHSSKSLGLKLVNLLVDQLNAEMKIIYKNGILFEISFLLKE